MTPLELIDSGPRVVDEITIRTLDGSVRVVAYEHPATGEQTIVLDVPQATALGPGHRAQVAAAILAAGGRWVR